MKKSILQISLLMLAYFVCAIPAHAQSKVHEQGWAFGGDVAYQLSDEINADGGSSISTNDDLGFGLQFAYAFNRRLELQFGLDWQSVDYNAILATDRGGSFDVHGDYHLLAPHVGVNFNLLQGRALTPFASAGLGWSWIDTDIPDAPPQTACWWDPWWGYYCGTFQSTKSIDQPIYQLGLGLRWDFTPDYSLRLSYEKRWFDFGKSTGTPDLDQFRLTFFAYE